MRTIHPAGHVQDTGLCIDLRRPFGNVEVVSLGRGAVLFMGAGIVDRRRIDCDALDDGQALGRRAGCGQQVDGPSLDALDCCHFSHWLV